MKNQTSTVRQRGFERVVVLLDVTVVVQQDGAFSSPVFSSVQKILEQCNEHSRNRTVWGYQLFDPSLKSLSSRSKIRKFVTGRPLPEQFDTVSANLERFGKVLHSLVGTNRQYECTDCSRADYTRFALNEIISDFVWDPLFATDSSSDEDRRRTGATVSKVFGGDDARRDANTVVCISSIPSTWEDLSSFLNSSKHLDQSHASTLKSQLTKIFLPVQEALTSRNIRACFVDVPKHSEIWSDERMRTLSASDSDSPRSLVLKSLSKLFHSIVPLDLLMINPRVIPPSLLWNVMTDGGPLIPTAALEGNLLSKDNSTVVLCEVELQPFKVVYSPTALESDPFLKFSPADGARKIDIELESVSPKTSLVAKLSLERFRVRQHICSRGPSYGEDNHPFGDKLLELIQQAGTSSQQSVVDGTSTTVDKQSNERGDVFLPGKPAWQLLLLTLASENVVCKVRLYDRLHGRYRQAIMEAFDTQCAVLTIEENCMTPCKTEPSMDSKAGDKTSSASVGLKRERDLSEYPGVTVLPRRKRHKVERAPGAVALAGGDGYKGEGQQQTIHRLRIQGSVESCTSSKFPLLSNETNLLANYVSGAKVSSVLHTMNDLFMGKKKIQATMEAFDTQCAVLTIEENCMTPCKTETSMDSEAGDKISTASVGLKSERDLPKYPGLTVLPRRKLHKVERAPGAVALAGGDGYEGEGQQQTIHRLRIQGSVESCTSSKFPLMSNETNLLANNVSGAKASSVPHTMKDLFMGKKKIQLASNFGFVELLRSQSNPGVFQDRSKGFRALNSNSMTEDTCASANSSDRSSPDPGRLEQRRNELTVLCGDSESLLAYPSYQTDGGRLEQRRDKPSLLSGDSESLSAYPSYQTDASRPEQRRDKLSLLSGDSESLSAYPSYQTDVSRPEQRRDKLTLLSWDSESLSAYPSYQTDPGRLDQRREELIMLCGDSESLSAPPYQTDPGMLDQRWDELTLLYGDSESLSALPSYQTESQDYDYNPSVPHQNVAEREAMQGITASTEQKVRDYISSPGIDCQKFAVMLFTETENSLRLLIGKETSEGDARQRDNGTSGLDLDTRIARKLKRLLLKSHKKLLEKYEKHQASSSTRGSDELVFEKARDIELQVFFRLEMILWGRGRLVEHWGARQPDVEFSGGEHSAANRFGEDQLIKEICTSLDSVQFCWHGGIFGGKDLQSYCGKLFAGRYRDAIPSTIQKILRLMDLEQVEVEEADLTKTKKSRPRKTDNRQGRSPVIVERQGGNGLHTPSLQELVHVPSSGPVKKGSYHFARESSNLVRSKKVKSGFHNETKPKHREVLKDRETNVQKFRIISTPLKAFNDEDALRVLDCNDSQLGKGYRSARLLDQCNELDTSADALEENSGSWKHLWYK